jgi:hypothetical protein
MVNIQTGQLAYHAILLVYSAILEIQKINVFLVMILLNLIMGIVLKNVLMVIAIIMILIIVLLVLKIAKTVMEIILIIVLLVNKLIFYIILNVFKNVLRDILIIILITPVFNVTQVVSIVQGQVLINAFLVMYLMFFKFKVKNNYKKKNKILHRIKKLKIHF